MPRMSLAALLGSVLALALLPGAGNAEGSPPSVGPEPEVTVYKSPTCGCCTAWAHYLRDEGFRVTEIDHPDVDAIKSRHGIAPGLRSCHTAFFGGYAIEGHVPAGDIRRLLLERPAISGLTAPGMPPLSPGMGSVEPRGYDVLTFDPEGKTTVFSSYR